jgi:hypothetical protein
MKLTTKELAFLAKEFPEQTVIGLFSNINQTPDGTEEKSLTQKGVLTGGRLTAEAKAILEVVAGAKKCTRLIVKNSFIYVEKYTYKANGRLVLAENDAGDMVFTAAEDLTKAVLEIAELVGMSKLKTADIEVLAAADEIMTLLALIDISRKNALLTYVGQELPGSAISLAEIQNQLAAPAPNSLVQMLKINSNYIEPKAEAVCDILKKLAVRGCVGLKEDGYILTDQYDLFAKSFLIPETVVLIESFHINQDNEIVIAGALGLSAGINDLVSFLFDGGQIEISSLSAFQMLRIIENFMQCPEIVEEKDSRPPNGFCPNCGGKTGQNATFCPNCGAKLG